MAGWDKESLDAQKAQEKLQEQIQAKQLKLLEHALIAGNPRFAVARDVFAALRGRSDNRVSGKTDVEIAKMAVDAADEFMEAYNV